jgi:Concanavalin A-like lectin/glucanases superfamily
VRRLSAVICIMLLLGAAVGIVALEAWHGSVLLSLSGEHGIDTGDVLAVPLAVLAIAVARRQFPQRVPGGWAATASAIVLGGLLVLAGVVSKEGGPLMPAGGGTFDGTIRQTIGTSPLPVDRWSDVALTYDGDELQLYVNGSPASSRPGTTGAILTPEDPLWIGGNRPYGEHFDGVIDEVRIYDRALTRQEIQDDMEMRVTPAPGLVAAYAFDAGSGNTAADSSGQGNDGEIRGPTWAPGRHGKGLRFNGGASVVMVPASASLNLTGAMTLSAWVRPDAPQAGWRTIVHRQTDAYFLMASTDVLDRSGLVDDLRAALVLAAAVWFCAVIATARSPSTAARRRSWWLPVALLVLGSLVDAANAPIGTLFGPTLVALWLATTASSRIERAAFLLAALVCIGLTIASVADIAGVGAAFTHDDGGIARSAALGVLFLLTGLARFAHMRATTR